MSIPNYKIYKLSNSGATDLNINGSVTPQTFSFLPGSGEIWYLSELRLLMQDPGGNNLDEFANLAGVLGGTGSITNGLSITVKTIGNTLEYCNIKDNGDIVVFADHIWSPPTGTSITNEPTTTVACFKFIEPIKLQNSTSDFIQIQVRDNLSSVNFLRAVIKLYKQV